MIEELALLDEVERRRCEKSYYEFFKRAWRELEPQTPLVDNWHIKYLCDLIQAEIERIVQREPKTTDLIVNIPPRSAKSYIFSILLCAWAWTRFPHLKFISSSHSKALSIDHCVKGRRVIESAWYRRNWGHVFELAGDQNVKSHFENNKGGVRMAFSVGASPVGHGADVIVADDLLNPDEAESEVERTNANNHYDNALFSRLNDQEIGIRINVQQRLHVDDPTGHILKKAPDMYRKICLPVEFDEEMVSPPELKPLYEEGLFFKRRFTPRFISSLKANMQPRIYAGQYQQRPVPAGGNIFKREWFRFYRSHELPSGLKNQAMSWDMSFKEKTHNDWVVGLVGAKKEGNLYILSRFRRHMGLPETIRAVVEMMSAYPLAKRVWIEDKANGPGIIKTLKGKIPGIYAVNPEGSKTERAHAITWIIESGNVWLPHPDEAPWVEEFLAELLAFPDGKHDDQVDALTQLISRFFDDRAEQLRRLKEALDNPNFLLQHALSA